MKKLLLFIAAANMKNNIILSVITGVAIAAATLLLFSFPLMDEEGNLRRTSFAAGSFLRKQSDKLKDRKSPSGLLSL